MTAWDHIDWLKASINEKAKATNCGRNRALSGEALAVLPSLDVGEQCGAETEAAAAHATEYGDFPRGVAELAEDEEDPVQQRP